MTLHDLYSKRDALIAQRDRLRRQKRSVEVVQHKLAMLVVKIIRAELREERKAA